ncbi:MAG: hypothetical protein BroJett024_16850 [Alphaproteobacteria bacterium]|nr:MAG: hypothetical protein BroJett024_16850 [Alphaproteobacteria bacterium]
MRRMSMPAMPTAITVRTTSTRAIIIMALATVTNAERTPPFMRLEYSNVSRILHLAADRMVLVAASESGLTDCRPCRV